MDKAYVGHGPSIALSTLARKNKKEHTVTLISRYLQSGPRRQTIRHDENTDK